MTGEEALQFAKSELDAAYERGRRAGHYGKTKYIEVLEMMTQALEEQAHWKGVCPKCGAIMETAGVLNIKEPEGCSGIQEGETMIEIKAVKKRSYSEMTDHEFSQLLLDYSRNRDGELAKLVTEAGVRIEALSRCLKTQIERS